MSWRASKQAGAALIAGAIGPLAFSPVNVWLLQMVSLGLLYILLKERSPKVAALTGLAYGLGFFGVGTSWIYVSIHDFGDAPPILAALITTIFTAVLAAIIAAQSWCYRRWCLDSWSLLPGFAATWVLGEWLRGWLFTGFPWLFMGYPHVTTLFSGLAPLFGVMGISFFIVLSGAIFGELTLRYIKHRTFYDLAKTHLPSLLLVIWGIGSVTTKISWTQAVDAPPMKVGIVQGNIEQSLKFRADYLQQSLDQYTHLSAPLWDQDLLVWPETAIPMLYQNAEQLLSQLDAQAKATDTTLISGIFYRDDATTYNSLVALGQGSGLWHKQKLVPFGEYVPMRQLMANLLQVFDLPMSSLQPGPAEQGPLYVGDTPIAPFICYEVVYADFVRHYGADAGALLTVSNDTWFGSSWGPHQHLQIAAMRARELERYMIRATNNGISAIINERGEILVRTAQFKPATLIGEVVLHTGKTPYARWGNIPVILLCCLLLAANLLPASVTSRIRI